MGRGYLTPGPRLQIMVDPPEKRRAFRGFRTVRGSRTARHLFGLVATVGVAVAASEVGALEELVGSGGQHLVVEGLGREEVPRRRL